LNDDMYQTIYNQLPYVGPLGEASDIRKSELAIVIKQIPESVRKIALERCIFAYMPPLAVGCASRGSLPEQALTDLNDFHLILISEYRLDLSVAFAIKQFGWKRMTAARRLEEARIYLRKLRHVLAHEIAHAFIDDTYSERPANPEAEANRLAAEWGFDEPK